MRYCGWAPGQLQAEIEKGVWFTVAASKDLIFHPDTSKNSQHWHTVMQLMGGEFKQVSDAIQVVILHHKRAGLKPASISLQTMTSCVLAFTSSLVAICGPSSGHHLQIDC